MLNSLLSLFYYLRWFGPVFARPAETAPATPRTGGAPAWPTATAGLAASASLALGIVAGSLWTALEGQLLL